MRLPFPARRSGARVLASLPPFHALVAVLAVVLTGAANATAGKVVMFYDAWPEAAHPFRIIGGWNGLSWQGPESSAGNLRREGPWYVKDLPSSWSATAGTNDIAFSTPDWRAKYGAKGFGDQSDIDIAPYLAVSDTVWIVPSPMPDGPPKLSATRPRQTVVMFLDPWPSPASVRIETGPWRPLKPSGSHPGWNTTHLLGFSDVTLLFRSPDSASFFGSAGISPLPVPFSADSLGRADTLWIRPAFDTAGPPVVSALRPRGKVVMLLNPWGGTRPVRRPAISWGGARPQSMEPSAERCGWYRKEAFARPPQVRFSNSAGATFGSSGASGGSPIDLAATFASHDTAWILSDPSTTQPIVRPVYTGETGMCAFSLLAATVRDFDTTHPDFEKGWSGVKKNMILPTLDADRKPIKNPLVDYVVTGGGRMGDTISKRLGVDWFRTDPTTNTETCRDIPLTLDTATGSYVHDSPNYFPIDDFTTLPDGSPNPRRIMMGGSDGRSHNFSFCLESHGEFDYRKGQIFRFRGDDDVWFFIDGHLVVDLGGVHGAVRDSVHLDQIGWKYVKRTQGGVTVTDTVRDSTRTPLVDGRTYNFDFFFCERQTGGSSMLIQTDMNMRTRSGFQVRDSLLGPGRVSHDLWVSQTSGQGCKAQQLATRTVGRFVLRGRPSGPVALPPGRVHFGGIAIDSLGSSATLDSTRLVGLAPGRYVLQAVSGLDSTASVEIPFTVPWAVFPRFQGDVPWRGSTPSVVALEVVSHDERGLDSTSIAFHLRPVHGLSYFADSGLTRPIGPSDTLMTGTAGSPRRVWVRGDVPGAFAPVVGRFANDSTDTHAGLEFLGAKATHLVRSPWTGTVRSPVQLVIGAMDEFGPSPRGASFRLRAAPGLDFYADSALTRLLAPSDTLRVPDGDTLRLWTSSRTPGTWSVELVGPDGAIADVRTDLAFLDKGLRFLDERGAPLAPAPWTGLPGDTLRLRFETFSGTGTCTACGSRVVVRGLHPGLRIGDRQAGDPDTVALVGGRGSILVRGTRPLREGAVHLEVLEDSALRSRWEPLSIVVSAPDSALVHDDDGDGRADRLRVRLAQRWTPSNALALRWPDSTNLSLGLPAIAPDSLEISFPVLAAPEATNPVAGSGGTWSWSTTDSVMAFPVSDRIPAKVRRAVLSRGLGEDPDTLRLRLTESVAPAAATVGIEVRSASGWRAIGSATATASDRLTLVLPRDSAPGRGDSVRTAEGSTIDASGNRPSPIALGAPVEVASAAPATAWALDPDGDGAVDRIRVFHPEPVDTGLPGSFEFVFHGPEGPLHRGGLAPRPVPGRTDVLEIELESPLPRGITSFAAAEGTILRDGLPSLDGPVAREDRFPVGDSVSPLVLSARIALTESYDAPDTLVVVGSEPVQEAAWSFLVVEGRAPEVHVSPSGARGRAGDTLRILLPPDESPWIRAGDSLRWSADGTVRDTSGIGTSPRAPRVAVTGSVRPPLLRLVPPRTMNRYSPESDARGFRGGIQIVGGTGSDRIAVDGASAAVSAEPVCPLERCTGPDLELNRTARVSLVVYDLLGTHVTGTEVTVDEPMLQALGRDRLGRARLSLRWDLADGSARPVADGVYLMRLVLRGTSGDGSDTMVNQVWKIGVHRLKP